MPGPPWQVPTELLTRVKLVLPEAVVNCPGFRYRTRMSVASSAAVPARE